MMLRKDEINVETISQAKVFHFGTLSMTHDMPREATIFALETAKKNGALITFDPNLREPLWSKLYRSSQGCRSCKGGGGWYYSRLSGHQLLHC